MNLGSVLILLERQAEEAGLAVDKYMKAATVYEKHQREQEAARQATQEEKEKITSALAALNGNISEDLPPSEIVASAGVRRIQGTMSFARYHIKQLLLEHKKQ